MVSIFQTSICSQCRKYLVSSNYQMNRKSNFRVTTVVWSGAGNISNYQGTGYAKTIDHETLIENIYKELRNGQQPLNKCGDKSSNFLDPHKFDGHRQMFSTYQKYSSPFSVKLKGIIK